MRIVSWNVNGIRAVYKKGFLAWLAVEDPDILCLQETKAQKRQLSDELRNIPAYCSYYSSAEKKGYSGVALYTKVKPMTISRGLGINRFDSEGRILIADYGFFLLFNVYFPNGKASPARLAYKMAFYNAFLKYVDKIKRENKPIVICGDVNTAHQEIDLARPKENKNISGFLSEERAWIDRFVKHGFIDTFRVFNKEAGNYTWWDYKSRARDRNIGWRIDYFFVTENLLTYLVDAAILKNVMGSDHCPVAIDLKLKI